MLVCIPPNLLPGRSGGARDNSFHYHGSSHPFNYINRTLGLTKLHKSWYDTVWTKSIDLHYTPSILIDKHMVFPITSQNSKMSLQKSATYPTPCSPAVQKFYHRAGWNAKSKSKKHHAHHGDSIYEPLGALSKFALQP